MQKQLKKQLKNPLRKQLKNPLKKKINKIYLYINATYKNILVTVVKKKKNKLQTILLLSKKSIYKEKKRIGYGQILIKIANKIACKLPSKNPYYFRVFISGRGVGLRLLSKLKFGIGKRFRVITMISKSLIPFNGCKGKKLKRR